jgi:hypothetical protein
MIGHFRNAQLFTIVDQAHHHIPRDLVMTGGVYNISPSLVVFERAESEFVTDMEEQRLVEERRHYSHFRRRFPNMEGPLMRLQKSWPVTSLLPKIVY